MLGRYHVRGLSCAIRFGRYCLDCGWDGSMGARHAKRMEARWLAGEIADGLDDYRQMRDGTVEDARPVPA